MQWGLLSSVQICTIILSTLRNARSTYSVVKPFAILDFNQSTNTYYSAILFTVLVGPEVAVQFVASHVIAIFSIRSSWFFYYVVASPVGRENCQPRCRRSRLLLVVVLFVVFLLLLLYEIGKISLQFL